MKTFLAITLLGLFASHASAQDSITVTVNGRTYQCSGDAGGDFKYYCDCGSESYKSELWYLRMDRATGKVDRVRQLNGYTYYGDNHRAECLKAMKETGICRD